MVVVQGKRKIIEVIKKRRDRALVALDILSILDEDEPRLKTYIMYKAGLSFAQLNEYLGFMLEKKYIAFYGGEHRGYYLRTQKGTKLLGCIKTLVRLELYDINTISENVNQSSN